MYQAVLSRGPLPALGRIGETDERPSDLPSDFPSERPSPPPAAEETELGDVGVGVGVEVGAAAQLGPVMVFEFSVTVAPAPAKTRPFSVAPEFRAVVSATLAVTIFPMKVVPEPRVAALPTLHHTLHASPPVTDEPLDVMIVETDLKIQTPEPVRLRFPVRVKLLVEQ